MKSNYIFCSLILILIFSPLQSQNDYYFPEDVSFEESIPSPAEFLGYEIGDWHTRYSRLVSYMEKLAELSPNAQIQTIGYTHEKRPQIILTISSEENLRNLENIRQEHLAHVNPENSAGDVEKMPVIVHLGYNVHGNEPSSSEVSMLVAYYLLAAKDSKVDEYLKNGVFHIEPALNPDGRDRHTTWVNSNKGNPPVADNWDREHNESWPSGRTNHYWFDLNRDWLPLTQVESKNRVAFYHKWLPNMVTDYHEMGSSSTYFFEPTKKYGSENPIVPRYNYDTLNTIFAKYHQESLDEIGSLYFTGERYDNSYPGYGSTYPDLHGALGIVYEQASSRGYVQKTGSEDITFPFTIRNHLRTSLATIQATIDKRELLLNWQRKFFKDIRDQGLKEKKLHVYGNEEDPGLTKMFTNLLLDHQIEVYRIEDEVTAGDKTFKPDFAYAVPEGQAQNLMVKTMFDKVTSFADSVFYDTSAWSMALAYGISNTEVSSGRLDLGSRITKEDIAANVKIPAKSDYAYLIDWSQFGASEALYYLLKNDVNIKTAFTPFSIETDTGIRKFGYGSLMISVADQSVTPQELYDLVKKASGKAGIRVESVASGRSALGIDLGSPELKDIELPKVVMLTGEGTSGYEAGEIWFMMDTYANMPITKVDRSDFKRMPLNDYDVLIMVSGNYDDLEKERIESWVKNGGTLITQRTATQWAIKNELVKAELKEQKKEKDSLLRMNYAKADNYYGSRAIGGSFYKADLDITHPIGFGYEDRELSIYKNSTVFLKPGNNPFNKVAVFSSDPYISGYIHPENLELIKGSAAILAEQNGRGTVIMFSDNPNFRAMMLETHKLFANAIFFGSVIF
ncbi:M14 metallopeptidase family protein [Christiangramia crocea]|uniref:M14 family metallopeptidase n=1 Tax=Christiangramia crocea TaxID=2904124 RepID=A0A9X1UZG8_9FLAO|nr:M14 metallopeptidase family protein [Gramella crocea]MCG9972133.1 M14 family metallopeptidase [Gramella crocea]